MRIEDATQWTAVLEALDEVRARIPEGDPHAREVERHLDLVATVSAHARARANRPGQLDMGVE